MFKRGKGKVSTTWLTSAMWLSVIDIILALCYVIDPTVFGLMDFVFMGLDPLTWLYIMTALVYLFLLFDQYVY